MLPEDEQEIVVTKYKGAEAANGTASGMNLAEQNQFLMMLLRAHCEAKQTRHVHDTAENRCALSFALLTLVYFPDTFPISLSHKGEVSLRFF